MDLEETKYVSMLILFGVPVFMTLIAICVQRFILNRGGQVFTLTQRIISCLTSGIFLGTLLMLILPNSLDLIAHQSNDWNLGYLLIGLGFFLICLINELSRLCEIKVLKSQSPSEKQQLISASLLSTNENQLTRLFTLVFALGVHYFFNGVLIGGQTQSPAGLWLILGVICFHMSLVAFSVTLRLLIDNENYLRVFIGMSLWSLMGPLGVLLSFSLNSNSSELNSIDGVLQCLSAGTFVYITFIDMICDDLTKNRFAPFVNMILIFLGFFIIVLASFWHQHPQ